MFNCCLIMREVAGRPTVDKEDYFCIFTKPNAR